MNAEKSVEIRIENRTIHLPDSYPAQAGNVVFLTGSIRGCLRLYQMQEWLPVRDRLFNLEVDDTDDLLRTAIRFVIGYGEESHPHLRKSLSILLRTPIACRSTRLAEESLP